MPPVSLADLLLNPPKNPKFIIPGILPERGRLLISGAAKIGKSYMALELASALVSGKPFLGTFPIRRPSTTFILQAEVAGEAYFHYRLKQLAPALNGNSNCLFIENKLDFRLDNKSDVSRFIDMILGCKPDVTIIDPLYAINTGSFTDPGAVAENLRIINYVGEKTNTAIVLVHHMRKPKLDQKGNAVKQDFNDVMGSHLYVGWGDTIIAITPMGDPDELNPMKSIDFMTRWMPPVGEIESELSIFPPFFRKTANYNPPFRIRIMMELCGDKSKSWGSISKRARSNPIQVKKFLDELEAMSLVKNVQGEYQLVK